MLGTFEVVARIRPVGLVQPGTDVPLAPYAAVEVDLRPDDGRAGAPVRVGLTSGGTELTATWDGRRVGIDLLHNGQRAHRHSRRHAVARTPDALALTLTGPLVTAWTREQEGWVARAVVDLLAPDAGAFRVDVHDERWLADLRGDPLGATAGTFGQLGLRDLRLVTHADGTPYLDAGAGRERYLVTATSAGPGGFRTAHTSVWELDPHAPALTHRSDVFLRRPDRPGVYGDHATHLVRDGDDWLLAASTWGDFDVRRHPYVTTTLATSRDDLTRGTHVLDTTALTLPTSGLTSVGTWDPQLVRPDGTDGGWLVCFVSATSFFRFHPVLATGPALGELSLRSAASDRTATEGPTLVRLDGEWRVLASDGRDGRRGRRAVYPVLDLDLRDVGRLDADYPTNLPWPTVLPVAGGWLMLGFDGSTYGGPLLGYGTHGRVVVQRTR